jgi:SAM-dependent methyltransferase
MVNDMGEIAFNEIADDYDNQIPKHIREHLCEKKVNSILEIVKLYFPNKDIAQLKALDFGCGTGWHVKRFAERGLCVDGIDISPEMIDKARDNNRNNSSRLFVGSAENILCSDGGYDFVYMINVLHHLNSFEAQINVFKEIHMVLKSKGFLFIHEVNEEILLFRIYMKYIFPLTNKIHAGQREERYMSVSEILEATKDDWKFVKFNLFTFLPNFLPKFIFPVAKQIETFLEKLTKNRFGAHWMMVLQKNN